MKRHVGHLARRVAVHDGRPLGEPVPLPADATPYEGTGIVVRGPSTPGRRRNRRDPTAGRRTSATRARRGLRRSGLVVVVSQVGRRSCASRRPAASPSRAARAASRSCATFWSRAAPREPASHPRSSRRGSLTQMSTAGRNMARAACRRRQATRESCTPSSSPPRMLSSASRSAATCSSRRTRSTRPAGEVAADLGRLVVPRARHEECLPEYRQSMHGRLMTGSSPILGLAVVAAVVVGPSTATSWTCPSTGTAAVQRSMG